jgi:hypothetical protein
MNSNHTTAAAPIQILRTQDENDLDQITSPDVVAVVYTPPSVPDWFEEVADAVEHEFLQIPRTILPAADQREIDDWLDNNLPADALSSATWNALKEDIERLIERIARVGRVSRFHLRIFTGAPTTTCGFHVDTVAPGASTWGLLRVYNGAGTAYVDPADVVSMRDFYRYLSRRERLERECREARSDGAAERLAQLNEKIQTLDLESAFLAPNGNVRLAPSRSIVAFKHLDSGLFWSDHSKALAWIHCSPMKGRPRFVVNVSAARALASKSAR